MSYLTVDDEEHIVQLSLLNDWDLDAAILNCHTSHLKLIVQIKPADESEYCKQYYMYIYTVVIFTIMPAQALLILYHVLKHG